jgi:hypothetical protein
LHVVVLAVLEGRIGEPDRPEGTSISHTRVSWRERGRIAALLPRKLSRSIETLVQTGPLLRDGVR